MTTRHDIDAELRDERVVVRIEPLREWVLTRFPEHTHPLTLVHDPDGLLADETILAELTERGFRIVFEPDPIALRFQIETARPWTSEHALIVRSESRLNNLPYDLWLAGHRVELGIHAFFPQLDYPTVRLLGPLARARLSAAPQPSETIGPVNTTQHLLRYAYGADLTLLREPASLLIWLADYHALSEPMPASFATRLATALGPEPAFADWDLASLLASPETLHEFLTSEWSAFLSDRHSASISETGAAYALDFRHDPGLQDALSRLVRSGVLTPVEVPDLSTVPAWGRPAARAAGADDLAARFTTLTERLGEALRGDLRAASWQQWVEAAKDWAALQTIHDAHPFLARDQRATYSQLQHALDTQFSAWLPSHYSGLATLGLPPHHLFHVPGFIAYEWRRRPVERIALLIIDGMALRDWTLIGPVWKQRHPDWSLREQALLAQSPTLTAISRQALVSGSRPAHFADSLSTNRFEPKQWAECWVRQDPSLPESACFYLRLRAADEGVSIGSQVRAVCLIESGIDEIVHGATLGAADVQASLRLWLDSDSHALERQIARLLDQGFRVYIASDHGHAEAVGVGAPSEGVIAETRGQRARVYRDRTLAERAHALFPDTIIWMDDGLLPNDVSVLVLRERTAFATVGERVVTHGGSTLDEMIVPFVTIESQERLDGKQRR